MQDKILTFIKNTIRKHGYPPSLREIGDHVGLISTSSVSYQLQQLEMRGLIIRKHAKSRSIQVVNGHARLTAAEIAQLPDLEMSELAAVEKILNDRQLSQ